MDNGYIYSINNIQKLEQFYQNIKFDNNKVLGNFLKKYIEIENKDKVNPIFSKSSIYSKFPPNTSLKKNKNFKPLIRGHNAWEPASDKKNNIVELLNKISESNYNIIFDKYNEEIMNSSYKAIINAIDIIYNKCINDITFQDIYISLNKNISNINFKYINIIKKNNLYYWSITGKKNKKGPFNTKKNALNAANNEYGFINLFVKKFIFEILNVDSKISKCNKYNNFKNELIKLSNFIGKLYLNNLISVDIIHNILQKLLNNDNKFSTIKFEMVYNIILYLDNHDFMKNIDISKILYLINNLKTKLEGYRLIFMFDNALKILKKNDNNVGTIEKKSNDNNNIDISIDIDIYIKKFFNTNDTNLIESIYNNIDKSFDIFFDELIYNIVCDYTLIRSKDLLSKLIELDNNKRKIKIESINFLEKIDIDSYIVDISNIKHITNDLLNYLKNQ